MINISLETFKDTKVDVESSGSFDLEGKETIDDDGNFHPGIEEKLDRAEKDIQDFINARLEQFKKEM